MSDQAATSNTTINSSLKIRTADDLRRLIDKGKTLTTQELKELNIRIKAFEEMARMEDRLKLLENRKRLYKEEQFATPTKPLRPTSRVPSNSQRRYLSI